MPRLLACLPNYAVENKGDGEYGVGSAAFKVTIRADDDEVTFGAWMENDEEWRLYAHRKLGHKHYVYALDRDDAVDGVIDLDRVKPESVHRGGKVWFNPNHTGYVHNAQYGNTQFFRYRLHAKEAPPPAAPREEGEAKRPRAEEGEKDKEAASQ